MPKLKRSLGLVECTLMGVGVMLGAGIYALLGQAAGLAGNAVWISFLLASLVAGCTGLSYAELSSFIPQAGGEYYYTRRAMGDLVAFLVSWMLVVGIAMGASAVAIGFAGYLNAILEVNLVGTACLVVALSTGVLIYGIQQAAWVAGACTVLEIAGLAVVVGVGLPKLGTVDYLAMSPSGPSGVVTAGALVFFAYIGFEEIVQLAEETRDARRVIPLAVLLSIAIATVLYALVAACAVSVLDWQTLGASQAPLADVVAVSLGPHALVGLSVIALFSTGNTVLLLILSAARLLYGMAEDGKMPRRLAVIHRTRQSPYLATLAVSTVSMLGIVVLKDLSDVASLTNFTLLAAFVFVNLALIVLRYREPHAERSFRVRGSIGHMPLLPLVGVATSLFAIGNLGVVAIGYGVSLAGIGLVFHCLIQKTGSRSGRDSASMHS